MLISDSLIKISHKHITSKAVLDIMNERPKEVNEWCEKKGFSVNSSNTRIYSQSQVMTDNFYIYGLALVEQKEKFEGRERPTLIQREEAVIQTLQTFHNYRHPLTRQKRQYVSQM